MSIKNKTESLSITDLRMPKKIYEVKYCLLGYGYASLIAYHKLLQRVGHDNIMILRNKGQKQIFTIEHEGFHFSPLPIFPVEESDLYNSNFFNGVPKQDPISVSFSELLNFDYTEFHISKGSLASFMLSHNGIDQRLCLGLKQWGNSMLSTPLSQVESKIKRHYISKNGNTRVGYLNGKSLFTYAIDKLHPNVLDYSNLEKIDVEKKKVHTPSHIVNYEKLISTIPIHYLLQYCNLEYSHSTDYASAYFYFFKYKNGYKANQIIYDCDYDSDVLRLFSISDNFLLVQLRSDKKGIIQPQKVKTRVKELIPEISEVQFAQELFVPMCYPLELITHKIPYKVFRHLKIMVLYH